MMMPIRPSIKNCSTRGLMILLTALILFCLLPLPAIFCPLAGSSFDTDDTSLFSIEEDLLPETGDTMSLNTSESDPGFWDPFLHQSDVTLGHSVSLATDPGTKTITNHSFLRYEFETLFQENLFFRFDGKATARWESDHRARAEGCHVKMDTGIRELYMQAGFDNFNIALGKKIVVWGKADTAIVTDVVSPRDLSDFIFTRIEDARIGQFMASAEIFTGIGNFFIFLSPDPSTDILPDPGTRYFRPLPGIDNYEFYPDALSEKDIETGIRYSRTMGQTDISIMAGWFYENTGIYVASDSIDGIKPALYFNHSPYAMYGAAFSTARGSFIYKGEMAFKKDFPLQGFDESSGYQKFQAHVIDAAAGIEFNANGEYQMSLECSNRHVYDISPGDILNSEDSTMAYYTFTKDFFNQTLMVEYMFFYHIQDHDMFNHFRLTYDYSDSIQMEAGYTFFNIHDDNGRLSPYKNEDRISFEIRYYF